MTDKFFDILSYLLGKKRGIEAAKNIVTIENGIVCTDDGEGNITITSNEEVEESDG